MTSMADLGRGPAGTVVAFSLIILTPFVNFLSHQAYPFFVPESLLSIAGFLVAGVGLGLVAHALGPAGRVALFALGLLAFIDVQFDLIARWSPKLLILAAGLLLVLWFLRRHAASILAVAFAVMLLVTAVMPIGERGPNWSTASAAGSTAGDDPPVFIHILLDEHAGLAGIAPVSVDGPLVRRTVRQLYADYGFRLYERAFSQHDRTVASVPSTLNLVPYVKDAYVPYRQVAEGHVVTRNAYFDLMKRRGYRLQVWQMNYLDFCSAEPAAIDLCRSHPFDGIGNLQAVPAPSGRKAWFIVNMYLRLSFFAQDLKKRYGVLRRALGDDGHSLPLWRMAEDGTGPLPALPFFDDLIAAAARARPGQMLFAHLLFPHYPYLVDRDCRFRPALDDWGRRSALDDSDPGAADRRRRALYYDQVLCATKKLRVLFEGMRENGVFERARIFIHSDHGSKISSTAAHVNNQGKLSERDYVELFSAHVAVRAPHFDPGRDTAMIPVYRLLKAAIDPNYMPVPPANPTVYLKRTDPSDAMAIPMPPLPLYDD